MKSEEETKAVLDFFKKNFWRRARPGDASLSQAFWAGGQGKDVTLRKAVDMAESQVAEAFADRPLGEASVREMLGLAYLNLGRAAKAVKQYEPRPCIARSHARRQVIPTRPPAATSSPSHYRLAGRTQLRPAVCLTATSDSSAHAAALAVRGVDAAFPEETRRGRAENSHESLKIRPEDPARRLDHLRKPSRSSAKRYSISRNTADAEPLLLSGYEGMKKQRQDTDPGPDKPRLTKAIGRRCEALRKPGAKRTRR